MKLICFDLDNTLIKSDKAQAVAYNKALTRLGFRPKDSKFLASKFGRPREEIARILLPKASQQIRTKLIELHNKYLINETYKYAIPIKNAIQTLKELKKNYKLAILSNNTHKNILCLLKGAKINKNLFDLIIGHDQVRHSKPYPDEILKAEKLMRHKADYMVGDTIYDIIAGKKAKVPVISVTTGPHDKKKLARYRPLAILKDISYLPKFLSNMKEKNN
ncbi:HAD family hydrolase [Candidatus Woesearchaeota archaeon]|nr:HAD family hydrolase [Candidatus Woesearchaeota archaeon]